MTWDQAAVRSSVRRVPTSRLDAGRGLRQCTFRICQHSTLLPDGQVGLERDIEPVPDQQLFTDPGAVGLRKGGRPQTLKQHPRRIGCAAPIPPLCDKTGGVGRQPLVPH